MKYCIYDLCIALKVSASGYFRSLKHTDNTATVPNQKWLTDITGVQRSDGKIYSSPILECYNGELVGLSMDNNMRKELCIQAFENACKSQGAKGMILHSDCGSQFTSYDYRKTLAQYGAIQSKRGTGRCYDNARMESFFDILKKEKLYQIGTECFLMDQVKSAIFRYTMV